MRAQPPTPSAFGRQLRHFRARSGMSQLELAHEAGTTARHVSFIETGRSRPGAELVLRLATALQVPIRERNALLQAAGLPAAYPEHALADDMMASVRRVLDRVLHTHEPFPAWVVAPGYRFLASNRGAEALFPGLCGLSPAQIVDLWFGPGPFRSVVENWADVVRVGLASLRRDALRTSDAALGEVLRRAEAHAEHLPPVSAGNMPDLPVVCPRLNLGGRVVRTIATVMRFDHAVEVTTSELRVELMFPADEASEACLRELGGAR